MVMGCFAYFLCVFLGVVGLLNADGLFFESLNGDGLFCFNTYTAHARKVHLLLGCPDRRMSISLDLRKPAQNDICRL